MADQEAFREFLVSNGYATVIFTPNGRWVGILRLLYHWTMHSGVVGDRTGHDRRYCYRTYEMALSALAEWTLREFEGEPEGWHKDPFSGRIRPDGDPLRQYMDGEFRPDLERPSRFRSITIMTGAGISAESGLATFRGADGLWDNHKIEDVCTTQALARDPVKVHAFYDDRRAQLTGVTPNPAHEALARLSREWKGPVQIVTQNIDDLHERAGSRNVIHMHGELKSARCAACRCSTPWFDALPVGSECPTCYNPTLRPNVVLFGETPYRQDEIEAVTKHCDIFVSIGTSGVVYPAAGLVDIARRKGAKTIEVNLQPSGNFAFSDVYEGAATVEVNRLVDDLLSDRI